MKTRSTSSSTVLLRLLVSAGVVAVAATLVGLSTWASFTDSTSASQSVTTGTVDIDLGAAGSGANRLDVAVAAIAPGDTAERALELLNTSNLALDRVTLSTTATSSSLLDTDAADGLQVAIDSCSVAWTETVVPSGGYSYTCGGTTKTVLASRPIAMSAVSLANVERTAAGGTTHLRVTTSLPAAAGNAFQGKSSSLHYEFTGVQRAATNR